MIYSGLDWSGSPGQEPHDRLLVIAIIHFQDEDLRRLEHDLDEPRKALRLPADYVFKHLKASEAVHELVFASLANATFLAHVRIVDKTVWTDDYMRQSSGPDRICDGIVGLILGCPDRVVANQRLFVDLPREELKIVRNQRTAIGQALRGAGRKSFGNVQPRSDHRQQGSIIQAADMIAGEGHQQGGLTGPYASMLGGKIRIV